MKQPRPLSRRPLRGSNQTQRLVPQVEQLEDRRLLSRSVVSLDSSWQFIRQDVAGAAAVSFNDSAWTAVSLPHTWNNLDGQDGGSNYYRGIGWYRKHYTVPTALAGQELFIKFDGALLTTDLYVNGTFVGEHKGGFAAFSWDLTPYLKVGVDNVLAVEVNNAADAVSLPQSGDITWDGGLYRHVNLIATDPLHISVTDYASPGIYLQQTNVSAAAASLQVTTKLQNDSPTSRQATVVASILDAGGNLVQALTKNVTVAAHTGSDVIENTTLLRPHLWSGRSDPYLYTVRVQVIDSGNGVVTDQLDQPLGLRFFNIDPSNGFFLNGQSYDLHGVGFQSDRLNEGWAISDADQVQDVGLIKEIGASFVRLVMYQRAPKTYDLLDVAGIVAWTEVPLIDVVVASQAFFDNAKQQLRELIRQNYNHPAVFFWGIYNELSDNPTSEQLVTQLGQLAHQEDPTRPTVAATNQADSKPINFLTDYTGFNKYFGWYYGAYSDFSAWADNIHSTYPSVPIGLSEYGAGASVYQHQTNAYYPQYPGPGWHPEEYQDYLHESLWSQIAARPYVWVKSIWSMFDFAVDNRNEGDTPGRNDKGLVTYDRKIRKDSFYWYKANWSSDPVLHIESGGYSNRPGNVANIAVYSNLSTVQLSINGTVIGTQTNPNHLFSWTNVVLAPGANAVSVTATQNGVLYTDDVTWYAPRALSGVPFARINFQPTYVPVPGGYLPDYGYLYSDRQNGLTYGWDTDNSAYTAVRGVASDSRYDTLISMEQPAGGHVWQLAVPNGTYDVHLVSGDASFFDSVDEIAVQGVLGVSAGVNTLARWPEAWRTIVVSNGVLSVTNADGSSNDKLDFIDINRIGAAPSTATHFTLTAPAGSTVGSTFGVTVTAVDAFGNTATGYTGTVHLTSSDGQAILRSDYTFGNGDAGSHTFAIAGTFKTAGSQTITAADTSNGSITGTTRFAVNAATATHYAVSAPATATAGNAFGLTVSVLDAFGNLAIGYTGTIHFLSSDLQASLAADYTFVNGDGGVHTFSNALTLKTAGAQTVILTNTGAGSISGGANVAVSPAAATRYLMMAPGTSSAGSPFGITVAAFDPYGNVAAGHTGTIRFASSDGQGVLPANYTFVSADGGVHNFTSVVLKTAGTQAISVTNTGTGAMNGNAAVAVSPAAATRYTIGSPLSSTAGSSLNIALTALDPYGNTATAYTGTVHLTSSDGQAVLPSNYTFVSGDAGSRQFAIVLKTAGSQAVTAGDLVTGTMVASAVIGVSAATANVFALTSPANTSAGNAFSVAVSAFDSYGNPATSYTGTVSFTSSDPQAILPNAYTFVSADSGNHLFPNAVILKTAGTQVVGITDTLSARITTTVIGVTPAAAMVYALTAPASGTAGGFFGITIAVLDAYGNPATGYTGTVRFTSSDSQAVLPSNYTFGSGDAGIHFFANGVALKTAGSQVLTAFDVATVAVTGIATIGVGPAPATVYAVAAPANSTAGNPFSITISALDLYGNTATGYTGTVHFISSDAQAALPGDYTFGNGDGGRHTFANGVTLRTAGSQSLLAIGANTVLISGNAAVGVSAATATLYAVAAPANSTAGNPFSVTVTAFDPFGNTATGFSGTVHFTSSDVQAALPPDYTFVKGDGGVHTFINSVVLTTSGSQTVTATTLVPGSVNGSITGTGSSIAVRAAAASQFGLSTVPGAVAGNSFDLTVMAEDPYGNIDSNYQGTVQFATSDDNRSQLPAGYTFLVQDGGVHVFARAVTLFTAGSQTITATDTSGLIAAIATVAIAPAPANHFALVAPADVTIGVPFDVAVTALDPYGNTDINYQGTIHFGTSDDDPMVLLPADYTFGTGDTGTHTFVGAFALMTPGLQTLTATDAANVALSGYAAISVDPGGTPPPRGGSPDQRIVWTDSLFASLLELNRQRENPTRTVDLP